MRVVMLSPTLDYETLDCEDKLVKEKTSDEIIRSKQVLEERDPL